LIFGIKIQHQSITAGSSRLPKPEELALTVTIRRWKVFFQLWFRNVFAYCEGRFNKRLGWCVDVLAMRGRSEDRQLGVEIVA
jgi:hypothetical protein